MAHRRLKYSDDKSHTYLVATVLTMNTNQCNIFINLTSLGQMALSEEYVLLGHFKTFRTCLGRYNRGNWKVNSQTKQLLFRLCIGIATWAAAIECHLLHLSDNSSSMVCLFPAWLRKVLLELFRHGAMNILVAGSIPWNPGVSQGLPGNNEMKI